MPSEVTKVGPKYQVTIPKDVRDALGLKVGDLVQARVGKGHTIIMKRKRLVDFDAKLEEDLAAAKADYRAGRGYGPFEAHEALAGLDEAIKKGRLAGAGTNAKAGRGGKATKRAARRGVKPPAHARALHR